MKSVELFNKLKPLLEHLRDAPIYSKTSTELDRRNYLIGEFARQYLIDTSPRIVQALRYRGLGKLVECSVTPPVELVLSKEGAESLELLMGDREFPTDMGKTWWKNWKTHSIERTDHGLVFDGIPITVRPSSHKHPLDDINVDAEGDIYADMDVVRDFIQGYLNLEVTTDLVRDIYLASKFKLELRVKAVSRGVTEGIVLLSLDNPVEALQVLDAYGHYQEVFPGSNDFVWVRETLRGCGPLGQDALLAVIYANRAIPEPYRNNKAERYQFLSQEYSTHLHAKSSEELLKYVQAEFGKAAITALRYLTVLNPMDKKKLLALQAKQLQSGSTSHGAAL